MHRNENRVVGETLIDTSNDRMDRAIIYKRETVESSAIEVASHIQSDKDKARSIMLGHGRSNDGASDVEQGME